VRVIATCQHKHSTDASSKGDKPMRRTALKYVTLLSVHKSVTREKAMKERRVRCKECGERFAVVRLERERTSAYCDACREERKRTQARERMQAMRARRRRDD